MCVYRDLGTDARKFTGMSFAETAGVRSAQLGTNRLGREVDVAGLVVVESTLEGSTSSSSSLSARVWVS